MPNYTAQSERLWLQKLTIEDHLMGYHALSTDKNILRWSSRAPPSDLEGTKTLLLSRTASDEQPWMEMYAIMLRPSGTEPATFIGAMGILRISEDGEAGEIGYGVLPDHWGKGYAPEALKLLVDHYWKSERRVQKDKLSAGTERANLPSQRVLEKAGFKKKEVIEKAFEAPNPDTGEMEWRSAIIWEVERPKA
ncbi:acyl-CoA N-acyltransferase [Cadophora sp. DSE1049]|nr:acyl-CoA N-acyltransferase [Cadophora sp. DSE1049]